MHGRMSYSAIVSKFLAVSAVLILTVSCATAVAPQLDELTYLEVLDTLIADPAVRHYAAVELAAARNISIHDDFVAFHIFEGQPPVNNGIRAELSVDYPFIAGDTVVYEWELRIPEGFSSDAPLNRWWVVAQWHDQPDPHKGESWDAFPSNSPPVALYLGELDGQLFLSPGYLGHATELGDLIALPVGDWLQLRVELRWSQNDDGYMKLRAGAAGAAEKQFTGPNMLNGYQHYLKLGMYRHRDISTDNSVHLRRISIMNGAIH